MARKPASRDALISRLRGYWKMEAGNVLLVPAILVFLSGAQLSWQTLFAFVPMMGLLIIGAMYWKAKLAQIEHGASIEPALRTIGNCRVPLLLLTAASVVAVAMLWFVSAEARGSADRWSGLAAATLAVLEYVNYYHRQLQHFDHWPDLKRLMSGGGFRKSQLRQDLDRLR